MSWVPMVAGMDYLPPGRGHGMGDPFIVTPGATADEQRSVHTAMLALDGDIRSSSIAAPSFRSAWALFLAEWRRFYDDQNAWLTGWWSRGTYAAWEKTREYRTRLEDWRRRFGELGGQSTAPPLGLPPPSTGADFTGATRNIAIAVGIVAALWAATTIYREVKQR